MIEVVQTDHGIDGWDAKSKVVATFDLAQEALTALRERGYSVDFQGKELPGIHKQAMYHREQARRWTMGAISYQIRVREGDPVPHNQLPKWVR